MTRLWERLWVRIAVPFLLFFWGIVLLLGSMLPPEVHSALGLATLIGSVGIPLLAWAVARRVTRPIQHLTTASRQLMRGETPLRLPAPGNRETAELIHVFNRMAAEIQRKTRALEEKRERLASILTHLADGILIADATGQVRMVNPAAARLLAASADAVGQPLAQVMGHHRLIELWRACRASGEVQEDTVHLMPSGRHVHAIVKPITQDAKGGYLVILQDVTEARRVEAMRRDFISNISHELRTPLASLKALADTLREGALEEPEMAMRFLDRIDREIDAMVQMVEELLELSRIESGEVPLHIEPVPLYDVVVPPVERLRPQADRAGLTLRVDIPRPGPSVLADAQRLPRVVTNLVHNAIKFTPPGGEITVFAWEQGDEVVVAVQDTGIGIPREALPRLFERFYKIDRARRGQGTGLGLSIARHLVQAHGGRIWAESEEGRGSTFYFTLPRG